MASPAQALLFSWNEGFHAFPSAVAHAVILARSFRKLKSAEEAGLSTEYALEMVWNLQGPSTN